MCEELRAAAKGFKKSSKTCNKQEPMGLFFFFIIPSHIALVFFLFNFKPETVPNHSIVWRCDLRESVLLVIIDVSSANCEIFTSWLFGKYMPSQFLFWRILRAKNSTARTNKCVH